MVYEVNILLYLYDIGLDLPEPSSSGDIALVRITVLLPNTSLLKIS